MWGADRHVYIIMCILTCVRRTLACALMTLLVVGCGERGLKPNSGGDPYEVLLVTSDTAVRRVMDAVLEHPVPALPQNERWFSVSHVEGKVPGIATSYARCIVMVHTDSALHGRTKIRYQRDVNARHQLMVSISAPSVEILESDMNQWGARLRQLLDRFELNTEADGLQRRNNAAAVKAVKDMFGWRILVPQDLTAMKIGERFLWLSDNRAESSTNICVYSYPGISLDAERNLTMRDSVMGANIPGEQPFMHMATERHVPVQQRLAKERGRVMLISRGLWQMEGDAMGGPFVSVAMVDSVKGMTIVAEGFVFAPGKPKRNNMKRLEAALLTLAKVGAGQ